jgi:hypothetical protein
MKNNAIHYIGPEWNSKFIIAVTDCGKSWLDVEESTQNKDFVTCKKCLKKINKK